MDDDKLRRVARQCGVPTAIVEKDYVLSVVLHEMTNSALIHKLTFKGGTALKKVYFKEARFSEDLDFSCMNLEKSDIVNVLKAILENKKIANVRFGILETERTPAGLRLALKYTSFLSHSQRIRFDFNFRENLVLPTEKKKLIDDYLLGEASVKVLSLPEVFAEKIHAVMSRTAARDLYDIWFLLSKDVSTDSKIVSKKFAYYNENLAFISEGQSYWGAPFTHLLIDPNALDKREWDYRVEATTDRFIAIARRKTGRYQDREIRLDNKGALSGNYLFWLSKIPSRGGKGVMKIYYENGALHREVFWENGEPVGWKEYDPSGKLISEKP